MTKPEIVQTLVAMITDVMGDTLVDIEATTSFRDDLAFQSIHFVALAELIQERWPDIDFVSWVSGKQLEGLLALKVGDVADFIVSSDQA